MGITRGMFKLPLRATLDAFVRELFFILSLRLVQPWVHFVRFGLEFQLFMYLVCSWILSSDKGDLMSSD